MIRGSLGGQEDSGENKAEVRAAGEFRCLAGSPVINDHKSNEETTGGVAAKTWLWQKYHVVSQRPIRVGHY